MHVLLFVKSSYFTGNNTNYISQEEWTKLWAKAMKLDYTPVVDIRTVKAHKRKSLKSAIIETAKYPVKPFDVDTEDVTLFSEMVKERITEDLTNGLHRKRQIGFGKLFKEIKAELALDDVEEGDLVQTGSEENSESTGREIVAFGIGIERIKVAFEYEQADLLGSAFLSDNSGAVGLPFEKMAWAT